MIPTGDLADAYAMMQQTNNYKLILPRAAPAAAGAAADAAAVPPGSLLYVNSGRSAAQVGIKHIKKYEQGLGGIGMQKSMDEFESECLSLQKVVKELDVSTLRAPCAHRARCSNRTRAHRARTGQVAVHLHEFLLHRLVRARVRGPLGGRAHQH